MKKIITLIAVSFSFSAKSQIPPCDFTTSSDGNLKSGKVYCLTGVFGVLNFEAGATVVVPISLIVGNTNGQFKYIVKPNASLNFQSSLNFNGEDSLTSYGGTIRSNSAEFQNGNNGARLYDGSKWEITGDLQLLEKTSSIEQCGSEIKVSNNYTIAGGVGNHQLCECAKFQTNIVSVNSPNVISGIGYFSASSGNFNNPLSNSSGITACLPAGAKYGQAMASCNNLCNTILSLDETPRTITQLADKSIYWDGCAVKHPSNIKMVYIVDATGRKLSSVIKGVIFVTFKKENGYFFTVKISTI